MIDKEKINNLQIQLKELRLQKKHKVKELVDLDTEIGFVKLQLDKLTEKKY